MPLVKDGKITGDLFVHVPDGAELPGDGAILVPAARFLADPETILRRAGKVGVIWPNNRDLDDLVPHLGRLAAVGTLIGPAVPYGEVADVVEDIVEAYLALRARPDELFIDTVTRLGVEPFKERVYATR